MYPTRLLLLGSMLWISIHTSLAQQPTIADSIRTAARSANAPQRLTALAIMSEAFRNSNLDSVLFYAQQATTSPDSAACVRCVMRCYNMIGTVALNRGKYPEAITAYHHARRLAQSLSNLKAEAAILNNLSIIYTRQGDYDKAATCLQQSLSAKTLLGDSLGVAASCINLGALYTDMNRPAEARTIFRRAETIYRPHAEDYAPELATAIHNIGYSFELDKKYDESLKYYMEALNIRRKNQDSINIQASLSAIAGIFSRKGQNQKALEYIDQAIEIVAEPGYKKELAELHLQKAGIYNDLNKPELAFIDLNMAISLINELSLKPLAQDCYDYYLSAGQQFLEQNNAENAEKSYLQALQLVQGFGVNADMELLYMTLADIYSRQGIVAKAKSYRQKAREFKRSEPQ